MVPEDFADVVTLTELLWQRKVGTHLRAHEREEEAEALRQSSAYRKSKALLLRQQE